MAEPSTTAATGIIAAVVLVLGPDAGDHALVLFGALIGAMHSVSKIDFDGNKLLATSYMARWMGAAIVLTAFVAYVITRYTGFPADRWPGVVAFGITFLADKWPNWVADAGAAIAAKLGQGGKP